MFGREVRAIRKGAAFVVAYVLTALLVSGNDLFMYAPLWPSTGVAVSGLWLLGLRWWPVVGLATVVHRMIAGYTFPKYLFGAVGNVVEAVIAVAVLNRLGFRPDFRRLRDCLALVAAATVAPVASALIGRSAHFFFGPETETFLASAAAWWRMNSLGIMVVVPVVLTWASLPRPRPDRRTTLEIAGFAALIAALAVSLLTLNVVREPVGTVLAYLALPIVLAAAVRFGVRGAATTAAVISLLLVAGARNGIGPFVETPPLFTPAVMRAASLQTAIAVICVTPLLLGAVIAEREAAQRAMDTAGERYEARLREGQKMEALGMLAGGVAHDFNNLLTVIGGYADLLRSDLPAGGPQHHAADEIVRASERASRLTRQLLAYSRRQRLEPEVIDLGEAVAQLGGMLKRVLGGHVRLVLPGLPSPAFVRVDRGQIEQVVVNLAINARDAMPDGGALTLAVKARPIDAREAAAREGLTPGPHVILQVRDEGTGMSAEVLERAFDPFYTTKPPGRGTGLGLSTVYGIVRQSGGAVWIESTPGRGTTVHVCLPAAEPPEAAVPSDEPRRASRIGERTVLVVEDEPDVRQLIVRALQADGHRVHEAGDGLEGLSVAAGIEGTLDLVVTDVAMPRMGGREFVERLQMTRAGTRVLFVSGYDADAGATAEAIPAAQWLPKPFTTATLVERTRGLLGEPRVPGLRGGG